MLWLHDNTETTMKIKIAALLLGISSVVAYCQGTLQISFDGPPEAPPGSSISLTNYYEAGMLFTAIPPQRDFSRVGSGYPVDPQDGTAYLRAGLTQSLMFRFTDGSAFGLTSVDLAEYSTGQQYPVTVQFIGYHVDGSTVTSSFTTDGIIDGTGPLADFQTFYFDSKDWSGLTRVEIPNSPWSLDNLVVAVPEPSAGALLLLGTLALGALKWRKRSSRQIQRLDRARFGTGDPKY
jgi:hypothetical protein